MQQSLEQHITDNLTNPTVGDVIGGRRTIILEYPTLPASLHNKILFKANDFAEMQDQMRPKYRLAFKKDILGDIQNPLELNFAQLNNHKLTLSFKPATQEDEEALVGLIPENAQSIEELPSSIPAHLIQVVPQVALDEVVIKTGEPMYMGYDLTLYYQLEFTNGQRMNKEYAIPAGSYVNLMFGAGSVSSENVNNTINNMATTKDVFEGGNENLISQLTDEKIFGDTLYFGSMNYLSQYKIFNKAVGKKMDSLFGLTPVFGTYGNEPNINYLFGLPINISKGGVSLNIYTTRQIMNNDLKQQTRTLFNQYIGINTSSLEHSIPEQQFVNDNNQVEAVSSIKALRKAMEAGQKIYQIDSNNASQISNLHFHPDTIGDITNAINAGYVVISHSDNISVQGWTGAGYIIMNPFTGDASFKITGGSNGGFLIALFFVILVAIFLVIAAAPFLLLAGGAVFVVVVPMLVAALFSAFALKRLISAFENANTEADAQSAILVGIINAIALLYPAANIQETADVAILNIIATLTGYGVDEIRRAFE